MISNPIKHFVTGSTEKTFTYEGGSKLFHFSPYDNNLSKYLGCNVIFFADSEEHGLDVLKRMFQFSIDCKAQYMQYQSGNKNAHWEEFSERAENAMAEFKSYLDAINEGKVKLSIAPVNQFYKVGWASNDTL